MKRQGQMPEKQEQRPSRMERLQNPRLVPSEKHRPQSQRKAQLLEGVRHLCPTSDVN